MTRTVHSRRPVSLSTACGSPTPDFLMSKSISGSTLWNMAPCGKTRVDETGTLIPAGTMSCFLLGWPFGRPLDLSTCHTNVSTRLDKSSIYRRPSAQPALSGTMAHSAATQRGRRPTDTHGLDCCTRPATLASRLPDVRHQSRGRCGKEE